MHSESLDALFYIKTLPFNTFLHEPLSKDKTQTDKADWFGEGQVRLTQLSDDDLTS